MRRPGPPASAAGGGGTGLYDRGWWLPGALTIAVGAPTWRHIGPETGTLDLMFQALADQAGDGTVVRLSHDPSSESELAEPPATSVRRSPSRGSLRRLGSEAEGETTVRFMLRLKADATTEAGTLPLEKILAEVGNYKEELVNAGGLLTGEGLQPSLNGARVTFLGGKWTVIDRAFAETKELITGFWIIRGASTEQSIKAENGVMMAPVTAFERPGAVYVRVGARFGVRCRSGAICLRDDRGGVR